MKITEEAIPFCIKKAKKLNLKKPIILIFDAKIQG